VGEKITFWVCAVLVVGGALVTITRRNTVTAVMALVLTFFGLAALYTLLSAHFLAAIQVLVYAGAIMTLFVFVVMVLNREEQEPWALRGVITKAIGVACTAGGMVWIGGRLAATVVPVKEELPPPGFGGVADVGNVLFTSYLFPFEAIALMLLVAVIGAVVVARIPRSRALEEREAADRAQREEGHP
jgi:NADH-quinone oxidoreductase subunit J